MLFFYNKDKQNINNIYIKNFLYFDKFHSIILNIFLIKFLKCIRKKKNDSELWIRYYLQPHQWHSMIPSTIIIPYIKNIISRKAMRNRTSKSRLPVTQSPLVITNRPRSFPYQAEASSKSTGGVFQVRIKSERTGEFSPVESIPTPCEEPCF